MFAIQSKHAVAKYQSYAQKALLLLYDPDNSSKLSLMEPLEALMKLGKATQVIEDTKQDSAETKWPRVDSQLCQSVIHYLIDDSVNAISLLRDAKRSEID